MWLGVRAVTIKTEPPESEKQASLESSVNLRLRIALPAGWASVIVRRHFPFVVSNLLITNKLTIK